MSAVVSLLLAKRVRRVSQVDVDSNLDHAELLADVKLVLAGKPFPFGRAEDGGLGGATMSGGNVARARRADGAVVHVSRAYRYDLDGMKRMVHRVVFPAEQLPRAQQDAFDHSPRLLAKYDNVRLKVAYAKHLRAENAAYCARRGRRGQSATRACETR